MTTSMTTARTALGALLALALLPALWPSDAAAHTCDDPFSTNLIAGQTIDAGDVKVCNDDTNLTVTYEATFPWCLLATNLHVALRESDIPQTQTGNPTPDEFAFGEEYGGCLDGTATFEIPLDKIDGGVEPEDTVYIAAHAEVENGEREEGAWGEGTRFVERGPWAMYFTYDVQETAVPCPSACVAGLNAFAARVSGDDLAIIRCGFDASRGAGLVDANYLEPVTREEGRALVGAANLCFARIDAEVIVDLDISNAEGASCAPLAVDILPGVDETNCDISPP
jgi:hypothetical protein